MLPPTGPCDVQVPVCPAASRTASRSARAIARRAGSLRHLSTLRETMPPSLPDAAPGPSITVKPRMRIDTHNHYYPSRYFEMIRETPSEFSFGTDPTGRTIIQHRGARFFG